MPVALPNKNGQEGPVFREFGRLPFWMFMPVSGPNQQFHTLYAGNHGWLLGWLRGRLGNSSDAADIAQDAFLRLLVSQRPLDSLGTQPRALLTHIARGLVIDRRRRQEVERACLDAISHLSDSQLPSEEERLIIVDTLQRVMAALGTLPFRTQRTFLLAQIDGMTLAQISAEVGSPVITVRRDLRKAILVCMAAGE